MRIALDVRISQFPPYSYRGFGYVTKNLTRHLLENDPENDYFLLGYKNLVEDLELDKANNFKKLTSIPFITGRYWFQLYKKWQFLEAWLMSRTLKKNNVDILLTFATGDRDFRIPTGSHKTIMVFYDLIPWKFKEVYLPTKADRQEYLNSLKQFEKAEAILTISESAKTDLLSQINFSPDKIFVVYPGLERKIDQVDPESTKSKLTEKYNIKGEYILHLGGYDFRHNVERVLKAYQQLNDAYKDKYQLVLAGNVQSAAAAKDKLSNLIKELHLEDQVLFTGFIDDQDIPSLYSQARVFVAPSLYEGFGLPMMDAMKYNCPVVTSNNSALGEIASEAALTVNPASVAEISGALDKILSDEKLRDDLIKKASLHVKTFNWLKATDKTKEIFKTI